MNTVIEVSKSQRIEYYFEALKKKNRRCANQYEAYLHLEMSLYESEIDHAPSLDCAMGMVPFSNFHFFPKLDVHVWSSRAHAIVISCNGAYGIYVARTFSEDVDFFKRDYLDPVFYKNEAPLLSFPGKFGGKLW